MFKKFNTTFGLFLLVSYVMVYGQVTNPSTFDLQFANGTVACDNSNSFCVDVQIKAASGAPDFAAGSHTIWMTYNKDGINSPNYTASNFSPNTVCSNGVGGTYSPYTSTNFSFSELGAMGEGNFTTQLGSFIAGSECPVVSSTWITMGTLCFNIVDDQETTNLAFVSNFTLINQSDDQPEHNQGIFSSLDFTLNSGAIPSPTPLPQAICSGSSLGTPLAVVDNSLTYNWYATANSNTILHSGASYTPNPVPSSTTNYFVEAVNGVCVSTSRAGVVLTVYDLPTVSMSSTTNVSCNGVNDGMATASASGGAGGFSYSWSNMANMANVSNLAPGTYTVTVTDANTCTNTASVTITEPNLLTVNISANADANCNGDANGSATAAGVGGTGILNYAWSNGGGNNAMATGLTAGLYTVTVTDANMCTATTTVNIAEPTILSANINTSTPVSCFGGNDGSATVSGTGGTVVGDYTYVWSNGGGSNATATGLVAGTYTVTVMDDNMCTTTATITINEAPQLSVNISASTDVSCNGGSDGSASALGNGGTGAFTYSWSNGSGSATATGLVAGTYTLTVTDANMCTATTNVTIGTPTVVGLTISSVTDVNCNGGSDGSAMVSATGGDGNYTYTWNDNSTGASLGNLSLGNYGVTVTDGNQCAASVTVSVGEPTGLSINISSSNDVSVNGGSDGSASASASGGTGSYNYQWSNLTTGTNINNVVSGFYSVTVTDANMCTASTSVSINEPSIISLVITSQTDVNCNGGSDGSASISASGGDNNFTYNWSSGSSQTSASNLSVGNYTVTVTDGAGATASIGVAISEPGFPVSASVSSSSDVSCIGQSDGSITATASGGTGTYTYLWSNTATTAMVTGLVIGTYTVTVTDANMCTSITTATINDPIAISISIDNTTAPSCVGASDGSIAISAVGGTGTYTYLWSNGGGANSTATGLLSETYTVTVTDANMCTATQQVTLNDPLPVIVNVTGVVDVSCHQGNDGIITVATSGGAGGYTYLWSNGGTTAQIDNLAFGTYTVTVSDANNCTASTTVNITEPNPLSINNVVINEVNCFGGMDGSIVVTATGGTGVLSYAWSNLAMGSSIFGLSQGTYTVTITDVNNCSLVQGYSVQQPTELSVSVNSFSNITCADANDGSIAISAGGGSVSSNYAYNWSSGQTSNTVSGLSAGIYTVTVSDDNNCTIVTSATITNPTVLSISINSFSDISIAGANDGAATATATGGIGALSYIWSNMTTGASVGNLSADTYTVTVSDANNCTATTSVSINEPSVINANVMNIAVSCNGNSDGSATVTASGGVGNYSYQWSSGGNMATENNLSAGTYTVTVLDSNGASIIVSTQVTAPDLLAVNANTVNHVSCNGASDGNITISSSGGTLPHNYVWSNGQTGTTINNLTVGTYTVTLTDANMCVEMLSVTITENPILEATILSTTPTGCNGGSDGGASLQVTGGAFPYLYNWGEGTTIASTANNLSANTYAVTITDANSCTTSITINITEPEVLVVDVNNIMVTDVSCHQGNDGAITVLPNGGTGTYNYLWSNGNSTNQINDLVAGDYTVTVNDANNCMAITTITVSEPTPISITNTTLEQVSCFGGMNGSIALTATGGTGVLTYVWSNTATGSMNDNLSAGTYTVTITDANNCTLSQNFVLNEPTGLSANISILSPITCAGDLNGSLVVSVTGGTVINDYTYLWSEGSSNNTLGGIGAGVYAVTITDDNGCTTVASTGISEPNPLSISISSFTNVSVAGGNNGAATATASGGTGVLSFQWSNTMTSTSIGNLSAGTYGVTVTDENGCMTSTSIVINEPSVVSASFTTTPVTCSGGSDGSATVVAVGGVGNYIYQWSNGGSSAMEINLSEATYAVTISDANGASTILSIQVTEPQALGINSVISAVSCNGVDDGGITISSSGGILPHTYAWSNGGTGTSINNLVGGSYTVTITDANNCILTQDIVLDDPTSLSATINIINPIDCAGELNGSLEASVLGGTITNDYTYNWSDGSSNSTLSGIGAGSYAVTITDDNGCSIIANTSITEPNALNISISNFTNVSIAGGNDGTAAATANGGTGTLSFQWSNLMTSTAIGNLSVGTYGVTVTDENGCMANTSVVINEPSVISASFTTIPVTCSGGSDGSATVSASGGVGNYTYQWSNGGSSAMEINLSVATYAVTISDANGASTILSIEVIAPQVLSINPMINSVSCNGISDGSVSIQVAGGTMPYSYDWGAGLTTISTINNLSAGSYPITVMDSNGCDASLFFNISEPNPLSISVDNFTNVSSTNATDGTATVSAMGGTSPYTFDWSNGASGSSIGNLSVDNYTVTATDANNCTITTSVVINAAAIISLNLTNTPPVCEGVDNGSATVTASGGTFYTYLWSNGGTGSSINNIGEGQYGVTVTDVSGSTAVGVTDVVAPDPIDATITIIDNVSCNGGNDGAAFVTVNGMDNHTYNWSTGSSNSSISNLIADTYFVTITTSSGCSSVKGVTIGEPDLLELSVTSQTATTCEGDNNGTATVAATGGTAPYNYLWANGTTTESNNQLYAIDYTITVTDDKQCTVTQTVNVMEDNSNCTPIAVKMFLEGAYNTSTTLMNTTLYADGFFPTGQPYNAAPWNYTGTEQLPYDGSEPANSVDWVLVELRDATDLNQIVDSKAGILLNNGMVVDPLGNPNIKFANLDDTQDYYIIVRHRNHIDLMSDAAVNVPNNGNEHDFTNPNNVMGTNQVVLLDAASGLHGMYSGDTDGDGVIAVDDLNLVINQAGMIYTYAESDTNLDGFVTVSDYNVYNTNATIIGVIYVRY